ncbi:hypothetical protein Tco_0609470 [Tanacetum coccineum]
MGMLKDVLCQVGVTTVLAKFLILDMPVDRIVPIIIERNFLTLVGALKTLLKKKAVGFLGSLHAPLLRADWIPKGSRDFVKEVGDEKWYTKIRVTDPYGNTFKQGYNTNLTRILPKQVYSPCIVDWTVLNTLGCGDTIKEMLEIKQCQEFYSTYEFDEVVPDDELMTKKGIKFRLCGRAHSLIILDFSRRLGLYTSAEIQDDRFKTYFLGGLRNDDHFNANQYWLNINSEEELLLSRSLAKMIRKPALRVLQKMITYGLCQRTTWYDKMKRKGVGTHRESRMETRQGTLEMTQLDFDEEQQDDEE